MTTPFFNIDKVILPPPMKGVISAIDKINANIPGEIVISPQGQILKKYIEYEGFVGDLIEIYNNWITRQLPKQVASREIRVGEKVGRVISVHYAKPMISTSTSESKPLLPVEARQRGLTYAAYLYGDIVLEKNGQTEEVMQKVMLGKIPVMLGSILCHLYAKSDSERADMGECPKDPLGYFIIKGTEKVILIQEKLRVNRFFIFNKEARGNPVCKMTCSTIRGSTVVTLSKSANNGIRLNLHFIGKDNDISVFQVFRILGITDTALMMRMVLQFSKPQWAQKVAFKLQPSFIELLKVGDDVEDISSKRGSTNLPYEVRRHNILTYIQEELYPHMNAEPLQNKLYLLALMTARYAEFLAGLRPLDDRDNWGNKRLESAGRSMEQLFNGLWNKYIDQAEESIMKKTAINIRLDLIVKSLNQSIISDEFESAFNSNNWGVKGSNMKENITDVLKRDTILAVFSHLTRINTPTSRQAKQPHIRMVQMSQLGYVCPVETPEGEACLEINTPVLNSDGNEIKIGELKDGDEIITIDPTTLEQKSSKIIKHFIKNSKEYGKPIVKITALNERNIICTDDHPFLTQYGWINAGELDKSKHLIAIWPGVKPLPHQVNESQIILDQETFNSKLQQIGVKTSLIDKHSNDLKEKGLLPLLNNHKQLPIIARICGFILADGSLGLSEGVKPYSCYTFGTQYDGELFMDDMEKLGFNRNTLSNKVSVITDKETGRVATHNTWVTTYWGCFASLLLALDITYGKRVEIPSKPVPDWIMNGSLVVKREFVAGFQGGDGSKITWHKRHDKVKAGKFNMGDTVQHKCPQHVESLMTFMNQIVAILQELGIEIVTIKKEKESDIRYQVSYKPSDKEENLIKYMEIIGYRYATTKNTLGHHLTEYLKYKHNKINERIELKNKINSMIAQGITPTQIAKRLNMRYRLVASILEYKGNGNTLAPKDTIGVEQWLECTAAEKNCIFMPIKSIVIESECMIADFTTVSDNHSMISANFVTHNCGLVKSKAVGCTISIERDEYIVRKYVQPHITELPTDANKTVCIINGKFIGWCAGEALRDILLRLRRSLYLYKDTTIVLDNDGILYIYTDAARPIRPILIVDSDGELVLRKNPELWDKLNNKPIADFNTMLHEGAIEYIDPLEQEYILIAQSINDIDARRNELAQAVQKQKEAEAFLANSQSRQFASDLSDEERAFIISLLPQRVRRVLIPVEVADAEAEIQAPDVVQSTPTRKWRYILGQSSTEESDDMIEEIDVTHLTNQELIDLYRATLHSYTESLSLAVNTINTLQSKTPYTHCEMDPNALFGVAASIIPFPDHNQAPRNVYQCVPLNTVVNINGKLKEIKDIKNGDEVLTINPETLQTTTTKIKNYFTIKSDKFGKKLYEITTYSGRKIQATHDHPFLTQMGWVESGKLDKTQHVLAIYPDIKELSHYGTGIILDEQLFTKSLEKYQLRDSIIIKHIEKLQKLRLLPLNADDERISILARMCGYLQADGHLGVNNDKLPRTRWTFGRENDAISFNKDMFTLGFTENKICECIDTFESSGTTHHTWNIHKRGCFATLLIALGGVVGRKTEMPANPIPDWIMNGSPLVKREFISGFMGGDGCKIHISSRQYNIKRGATYDMSRISQHKIKEYVDSSVSWFNQLKALLNEFDIKTSEIKTVKSYEDKYRIDMEVASTRENLIRYIDIIGYRYATTKYTESLIVTEWLKYVEITLKQVEDTKKLIYTLHNEGWTHPQLAKKFGLTVYQSQHYYKGYTSGKVANLPQTAIRLEDWINMVIAKENCIFVPIASIEERPACMVADFETESDNHSFVAGDGFVVSNCAMGKQALGAYNSNHQLRFDTTVKMLAFPGRPLFETQMNSLIGLNEMPAGETVICAIMTYGGYNQEDAIIFNKASIERGLFTIVVYRSYKSMQKDVGDNMVLFNKPQPKKGEDPHIYDHLDDNGIVKVGSVVKAGDIIIGKVMINRVTKQTQYAHTRVPIGEEGIVDRVLVTTNANNVKVAKVKIRKVRFPIIGDKFASRHAQKATIGMILPEEDMPFTQSGMRPDVIINPHCIPSRMTIAKLIEIVASKVAALRGERVNASAFNNFDIDTFKRNLVQYGFNEFGNEVMYNGMTGKPFQTQIFIGPCYYQALRHHVLDKIQFRSRGAIKAVSHQPTGGRQRGGGLRFGEMERDALISHGAARVLQERLCISSDAYRTVYCKTCGTIAIADVVNRQTTCRLCKDKADFGLITIPYAFKVLQHLLIGAGLNLTFGLVTPEEDLQRRIESAERMGFKSDVTAATQTQTTMWNAGQENAKTVSLATTTTTTSSPSVPNTTQPSHI